MDIERAARLSKNVLRMKFMQRSLDPEAKKQLEEEERRIISDEHWYLDIPEVNAHENVIVTEGSFVSCEDLIFGRVSFHGFNPEVEKLMAAANSKDEDNEEDQGKMEADVTDEDMANRYASLVDSLKRKYAKKREHSDLAEEHITSEARGKKVFLKPSD